MYDLVASAIFKKSDKKPMVFLGLTTWTYLINLKSLWITKVKISFLIKIENLS